MKVGTSHLLALSIAFGVGGIRAASTPSLVYYSSWNVDMAKKSLAPDSGDASDAAELDFYQARGFQVQDVGKDFTEFIPGLHNQAFNSVRGWWKVQGTGHPSWYPYVGKSKDKSSDMGGVNDLIFHPPNTNDYVVTRFKVPKDGKYQIDLIGSRRVDASCGNGVTHFSVFDPSLKEIYTANNVHKTTSALPTPTSGNFVKDLGALKAGQYIYFAKDRAGSYACDNVYVRFRIGYEEARSTPSTASSKWRFYNLEVSEAPKRIKE